MLTIDFLKKNNLILFECISGSRAYGLATESSDTDIRGVFYLPKNMFYGLHYVPQVSNETNDIVYYELGRFIELLAKNNPNILEMLATPDKHILYKHELFQAIQLKDFLSKLTKETFLGYAYSQIKKASGLNKKMYEPMPKERKSLLAFCYLMHNAQSVPLATFLNDNHLQYSDLGLTKIPHFKDAYHVYLSNYSVKYRGVVSNLDSNEVVLSTVSKNEKPISILYFNKDEYQVYCKKYREYWDWMSKRNEERYQNNANHNKGYDAKNMMHTIRLLEMSLHIFKDSTLNIEVENRDELLKIKSGFYSYQELLQRTESIKIEIEKFAEDSNLMNEPDQNFVEDLLVQLRIKLYE